MGFETEWWNEIHNDWYIIDWNTAINWNAMWVLLVIISLYAIYRLTKKSKTLGKFGMNTNNLILMGNLKNVLNYMPDEKQEIYKKLFHSIIMAQDKTEEILAMEEAIDQLNGYVED